MTCFHKLVYDSCPYQNKTWCCSFGWKDISSAKQSHLNGTEVLPGVTSALSVNLLSSSLGGMQTLGESFPDRRWCQVVIPSRSLICSSWRHPCSLQMTFKGPFQPKWFYDSKYPKEVLRYWKPLFYSFLKLLHNLSLHSPSVFLHCLSFTPLKTSWKHGKSPSCFTTSFVPFVQVKPLIKSKTVIKHCFSTTWELRCPRTLEYSSTEVDVVLFHML